MQAHSSHQSRARRNGELGWNCLSLPGCENCDGRKKRAVTQQNVSQPHLREEVPAAAKWTNGKWLPLRTDVFKRGSQEGLELQSLSGSGSPSAIVQQGSGVPGDFRLAHASLSVLLTEEDRAALRAATPWRFHHDKWSLRYSTAVHGFSLKTLYRSGCTAARSVMLVGDFSGAVFGAFCTAPWKVNTRFQGTGEAFVFQLRPQRLKFSWTQPPDGAARTDFFMLLSPHSMAIGGVPQSAIRLDEALLHGSSGYSDTFASPVLAGSQDFKVKGVELWQIGADAVASAKPKQHR